jgi:hypothetical protein
MALSARKVILISTAMVSDRELLELFHWQETQHPKWDQYSHLVYHILVHRHGELAWRLDFRWYLWDHLEPASSSPYPLPIPGR